MTTIHIASFCCPNPSSSSLTLSFFFLLRAPWLRPYSLRGSCTLTGTPPRKRKIRCALREEESELSFTRLCCFFWLFLSGLLVCGHMCCRPAPLFARYDCRHVSHFHCDTLCAVYTFEAADSRLFLPFLWKSLREKLQVAVCRGCNATHPAQFNNSFRTCSAHTTSLKTAVLAPSTTSA